MPISVETDDPNSVYWWHSIDLHDGRITPGVKTPEFLQWELNNLDLPDLAGKTVLDIGAWDGFFSFHAEQQGASRVVAIDHYVWEDERIGKTGFDLAHRVLGSRVEAICDDFMTTDLEALGKFDIVLYLGILYHMRHPLLALERLAQVTGGTAYIESQAIALRGYPGIAAAEFYETTELRDDPTNWWAPTSEAIVGMCRAAGFKSVELLVGPPDVEFPDDGVLHYAAVIRAKN